MLTIGEPIKPNTARRFTASTPPDGAGTDPFCERIVGSYALMSMNFTPKDMLLLMFASPEIAEFGDQITNIGEISNITNSRGFLLNIVNNVINRILLAEHETLLYKDEIYIANVLRRLGVADVNDFLKEVSAVTEESRTVFRLAEHYERNARFLRETRMTVRGDETSKDAVGGTEEPDAPELPPASGEPLFGEIFRRTGLERIVSVLRSYGTYERGERVSSALELNASEWFGVWNAVKLFESRRNVSVSAFSPVHRHYNVYETGAALPPDAEDSQIVGSAAVAALINVAHNALLARLARATQADVRVRVDVAQIFPTATASTLERFRSWHTERIGTVRAERVFERRLSELDRLEERLFARMREERLSVDSSSLTFLVDTRAEITPDESGEDESSALWRESHYRSMLSRIRQERDHIERLTQLVGSSESADAIEQFLERVRVSDPASRRIEEIARMNLLPLEDRAPAESSAAAAARLRRADGDARDFLLEVIERGMSGLSGAEDAGSAETRQEAELYVARPEETEEERDIALEARLKADLDAYDRRNKEIAQQFAERAERARHRSAAGDAQRPDAGKRTAIEALAGLDDSGKL
ncbi:MAG: hypothetical protein LBO81_01285, partial [Clostridiales Family XIII bacterium]|nr:hypothetical protein [Clostridiales Family XIII bacterium]